MRKFCLLMLLCLFGFSSCEEEYYTTIPRANVSFKLDLELEDPELKAKMAYKTFTQPRKATDRIGYGGLLIINGFGKNVVDLYAYDLSCPVEAKREFTVIPSPKMDGTAYCPQCGAVYDIGSGLGIPIQNGTYHLRSYRVSSQGNGRYIVTL